MTRTAPSVERSAKRRPRHAQPSAGGREAPEKTELRLIVSQLRNRGAPIGRGPADAIVRFAWRSSPEPSRFLKDLAGPHCLVERTRRGAGSEGEWRSSFATPV